MSTWYADLSNNSNNKFWCNGRKVNKKKIRQLNKFSKSSIKFEKPSIKYFYFKYSTDIKKSFSLVVIVVFVATGKFS